MTVKNIVNILYPQGYKISYSLC